MTDAIARLVHTYADSVSRASADSWGTTWAPDAVWDMGGPRLSGREHILAAWVHAMAAYEQVIQVVYNGCADVDEDAGSGSGRWYIGEFLKPVADAPKMLLAYYDDDYVKVDGEWLFGERRLNRLYSGPPDLSGSFTRPPAPPVDS